MNTVTLATTCRLAKTTSSSDQQLSALGREQVWELGTIDEEGKVIKELEHLFDNY